MQVQEFKIRAGFPASRDQYPMGVAGQPAGGLIRTPPESDYLLKRELVAFMTGPKAEPVVKSMGIPARFVGRELNHTAAAHPTLRNCPFEHLLPKTGISLCGRDPDALDLAAPHPALRQTGKKCQLQRSNQAAILQSHCEKVTGIGSNGLKGLDVALSRRGSDCFPFSTKLIIRKQGNDVLQVLKARGSHTESNHYALSLMTQADTGLSSTAPQHERRPAVNRRGSLRQPCDVKSPRVVARSVPVHGGRPTMP
jgi:hypothetical protein